VAALVLLAVGALLIVAGAAVLWALGGGLIAAGVVVALVGADLIRPNRDSEA
jgi:hypothetical protein